ncbi:hypothetical protein QKU48_gp1298 [Fadolivirus algeromassiliense]|jgi:hypothetical protein|uniref:Uncharacterized protein n=1 Tax=Fadolivirus FV1/VV64 TaxID=3070911 RepID=A0A7D3V7Z7_9VIRU|nr:hypothetical protein QKU48_gp1298 [Fadolivirus algeromassiliense]QKF94756.1 hypothetical protein Fadolivirus_1_1298 [Fadolivirus FV1/VV64]
MTTDIRKCTECDHSLFTRYDTLSKKYYCLPHHPNKLVIIDDRRIKDNILLGIENPPTREEQERLDTFYKKIICNKNAEIQSLKNEINELQMQNSKLQCYKKEAKILKTKIKEISDVLNNYRIYFEKAKY